ncbi:MAG: twin transmembrane helix small protein [Pseudomonadota bacterium]
MSLLSKLAIAAALLAVAVVLFMGLANMMKGGSSNRSQQLMRWRVILQAIALVVVMIVAWFASRS